MTANISKAKAGDVLVQSLSRFAQRLDGKGFYCVQEPSQTKTVRYRVYLKERDKLLGYIAWKGPWHAYAFYSTAESVYEHRCLGELAEILDYLSKLQRRRAVVGRGQA